MIDLTDITQANDISIIVSSQGGYLEVFCRQSIYEFLKTELTQMSDVYGIPIKCISELTEQICGQPAQGRRNIQVIAWKAGLKPSQLGEKIATYFTEKGYVVNLAYSQP